MGDNSPRRVVLAITGASGSAYGVRALKLLTAAENIESHLVVTPAGGKTLRQETGLSITDLATMASHVYRPNDIGAAIASGSFSVLGMLVAPCSIRSLSAIAHSYSADLISRAADVTLKEGRPLVLMVRETPLHLGHLRLMTQVAECGGIIAPPVPAFYQKPQTLEEVVEHSVRRALSRLGLADLAPEQWMGLDSR